MISASVPIQRPADARLLVVDSEERITNASRSVFPNLLHAGDVVIANDAATLPASLFGVHNRSGQAIEVRLAGRESVNPDEVKQFSAVVFGKGDYHTPTERRPSPPELRPGDTLQLGPLNATILRLFGHPRLVIVRFDDPSPRIWEGLARYGRPIQYSHIAMPLAIWDTWTPMAGPPVAFEPPSAGFALDWRTIDAIRRRGVHFVTITHAAGISSTGDEELDAGLPFDEPYRISESTARSIHTARAAGGRVIAIGTTVVRALEHCVSVHGSMRESTGMATNKIGPTTELRVVDAILSGTHEPGTSHHNLLAAFVDEQTLHKMDHVLQHNGYRTHEFGDSVFVEKSRWKSEVKNDLICIGPSDCATVDNHTLARTSKLADLYWQQQPASGQLSDTQFAAMSGLRVLVCDNMAFTGDFTPVLANIRRTSHRRTTWRWTSTACSRTSNRCGVRWSSGGANGSPPPRS